MNMSLQEAVTCLHCGRQLSLFQRLRASRYCDDSHRDAHSDKIARLALLRLSETEKTPAEIRWEQCQRRMNLDAAGPHS
jgi:hypothetical protein